MSSKIEWLGGGHTWNPIRAKRKSDGKVGWFCTKVSTACAACYAETQNMAGGHNPGRFGNGVRYAVDQQKLVEIYLDEKTLEAPLHWKQGAKIFPCSMTDLYGEWVPDAWLDAVYEIMARTPQHFYIVLTKRSERRRQYLATKAKIVNLPNVIEMASFGTQKEADEEVPTLLATPAAWRGVSAEPLLEYVDLLGCLIGGRPGLNWTIVGGESGFKARPFNTGWAEALIEQCKAAKVALFLKQLGANPVCPDCSKAIHFCSAAMVKDRKGGKIEEWPKHLQVREYPEAMKAMK